MMRDDVVGEAEKALMRYCCFHGPLTATRTATRPHVAFHHFVLNRAAVISGAPRKSFSLGVSGAS